MSKWNRPMRTYDPDRMICPDCGKVLRSTQAIEWRDGAYRHATNCTAPPTREAYAARVAAKRAARVAAGTGA
jgi:hypothetical protein